MRDEVFSRTISRLEGKGTIKAVKGNAYEIALPNNPIQLDHNHELFDKCKELGCSCKLTVDYPLVPHSPTNGKRVEWEKISVPKTESPFVKLVNLFYAMVGGKSPNMAKEVGILVGLKQKYTFEEIEIGVKYCTSTGKMYNLALLPWIMNEALSKANRLKNLSEVERAKHYLQNRMEGKALQEFGVDVVRKAKNTLDCEVCKGIGYVSVGTDTYKRCKCL